MQVVQVNILKNFVREKRGSQCFCYSFLTIAAPINQFFMQTIDLSFSLLSFHNEADQVYLLESGSVPTKVATNEKTRQE